MLHAGHLCIGGVPDGREYLAFGSVGEPLEDRGQLRRVRAYELLLVVSQAFCRSKNMYVSHFPTNPWRSRSGIKEQKTKH